MSISDDFDYGVLEESETTLLVQLTYLCRLLFENDSIEENDHSEAIESVYLRIWKDLNNVRPDLIERLIEVEGIIQ